MLTLVILFIIYWFFAFTVQLGVSLVTKEGLKYSIQYIVAESLLVGWIYIPIEIGEVIGYMLNKIK